MSWCPDHPNRINALICKKILLKEAGNEKIIAQMDEVAHAWYIDQWVYSISLTDFENLALKLGVIRPGEKV